MKKIRTLPLILLICLVLSSLTPGALALDDPEVGANAAVLADVDSGRVFYSKNADERVYPASLTKVMTILLAVEAVEANDVSLSDMVTATANSQRDMIAEGSTSNILPDETMSLENLMYCAMLSSANESCNIIGEYISGSIDKFVDRMNERAKELGCTGTNFTNPHGLPHDNHYTTASDMYLIMSEAIDHDLFETLYSAVTYTVPATNLSGARELANTNGLINADAVYYHGYFYEYAVGGKTGHTTAAGYCLVSTATKDGVNVLSVVMGCEATNGSDGSVSYGQFEDSITLYDWVFNNYSIQDVLSSSELITTVPVEMSSESTGVSVRPNTVITALIPNDIDIEAIDRSYVIYSVRDNEPLVAPISSGAVLGEVTVSYGGTVYGSVPLIAATSIELSKAEYLKHQLDTVLDLVWVRVIFWVLIICLIVYLLLVVRYRVLHKRHQRDVRLARLEREERMAKVEQTRVFNEAERQRNAAPRASPPANSPSPTAPDVPTIPVTTAATDTPVTTSSDGFFTPKDVAERPTVTVGSGAISDEDSAKRDYFEEFFNNSNK